MTSDAVERSFIENLLWMADFQWNGKSMSMEWVDGIMGQWKIHCHGLVLRSSFLTSDGGNLTVFNTVAKKMIC